MPQVMTAGDINRAVRRLSHEILEGDDHPKSLLLIGLHTRGAPLAGRMATVIRELRGSRPPVGELDIGLHRDDLARRPMAELARTFLPGDITGRRVILVDDVLYTGRTVRSALDALNDHGRPAAVRLAVLVDRGHRQLPIRPDYVGRNVPTSRSERVSVALAETDRGREGVWIESPASPEREGSATPPAPAAAGAGK